MHPISYLHKWENFIYDYRIFIYINFIERSNLLIWGRIREWERDGWVVRLEGDSDRTTISLCFGGWRCRYHVFNIALKSEKRIKSLFLNVSAFSTPILSFLLSSCIRNRIKVSPFCAELRGFRVLPLPHSYLIWNSFLIINNEMHSNKSITA